MCVDHTVGFYVWGTQRSKPFAAQEIKLKQVGRVRINCSFRLYTVDQSLKAICMTYTAQFLPSTVRRAMVTSVVHLQKPARPRSSRSFPITHLHYQAMIVR